MPAFAELTSPEIDKIIAAKPLAMIPVGQIEEHGPHLPVNADAVIAERLTGAVAAKLEDLPCLLLPTHLK